MNRQRRYWFPAKRYGWGWGLPSAWQGWVVFALYVALVVAICVGYPPKSGVVRFVVLVAVATGLLTLVCWLTGEPPRWSWGEKRDGDS
jgi:hypothetical protein